MKLRSQRYEIELQPKDLMEGLLLGECLDISMIQSSFLRWHYLLKETLGPLGDLESVTRMKQWGLTIDAESLSKVEHILKAKRKRYQRAIRKIEDIRISSEYDEALSHVRSLFGHTLQDGTQFYEYQLQDLALAMLKPRLLLCYEMGLGSATRSAITNYN